MRCVLLRSAVRSAGASEHARHRPPLRGAEPLVEVEAEPLPGRRVPHLEIPKKRTDIYSETHRFLRINAARIEGRMKGPENTRGEGGREGGLVRCVFACTRRRELGGGPRQLSLEHVHVLPSIPAGRGYQRLVMDICCESRVAGTPVGGCAAGGWVCVWRTRWRAPARRGP